MLFVTLEDLETLSCLPSFIDGVELRLDLFKTLNFNKLQEILKKTPFPVLFTLRKASQGGGFLENEEKQKELILKLLLLRPAFFDLEYDMDPKFILEVIKKYPEVKIILSHHHFTKDPLDVEELYKKMSSFPAYGYKIATTSHSVIETLSLLLLSKKYPLLTLIPMGEDASFSRVISLTYKNKLSYVYPSLKTPLAPGQLSLEEISSIYHYPKLNDDTKLYGLIGDPITHSVGHLYHNRVFNEENTNALYVKMRVKQEELKDFFPLAKKVGFLGLSVTMPLKESVLPFLDKITPKAFEIKAVNTLLFENDLIYGTNVDGEGALDAIETHTALLGKTLLLLGAGGASRAIAYEAKKRGAHLFIANRTVSKAKALTEELKGEFSSFDNLPLSYDILINTVPNLVLPKAILPSAIIMDIVYFPKKTLFLQKALEAGCSVVYGEEMFTRQAEKQLHFWNIKKAL